MGVGGNISFWIVLEYSRSLLKIMARWLEQTTEENISSMNKRVHTGCTVYISHNVWLYYPHNLRDSCYQVNQVDPVPQNKDVLVIFKWNSNCNENSTHFFELPSSLIKEQYSNWLLNCIYSRVASVSFLSHLSLYWTLEWGPICFDKVCPPPCWGPSVKSLHVSTLWINCS